ncbi:MAG: hypothetical protein JSR47_22640 [Proteobacteria bacterium]|nr:hypothetical protein [Pseudomonadota bacterium]
MKRRSFLLATLAGTAAPTIRAAWATDGAAAAYGSSLVFAAYRNGQPIGTHALAFQADGDEVKVATTIDFAVKALGLVVYRYRHRCQEIQAHGRLRSLSSQTSDDGAEYAVEARQEGGGLTVQRREPQSVVKTSTGDEALRQPGWIRESRPANLLPTTHWNIEQTRRSAILNSQTGKVQHMTVSQLGRETIKTAKGSLTATRYAYAGEIPMQQWFDDRGRWVKSTFQAFDGSTIEYILQE